MTPFYEDRWLTVWGGDCREVMRTLPAESVHCVVTSPPYWGLRDYGDTGQIGLEKTPEEYVATLVDVFREVRRVLRDDGTLWLNLGDSYGHGTDAKREASRTSVKVSVAQHEAQGGRHSGMAKQLVGVPWRVAFALQADGWYLRSDIIWSKPNPMPESITDRPTRAHEYVFLLAKRHRYYYDIDAIREPFASAPSDLRKMAEGKDRIGGLVKDLDDPLLRASSLTNIGRKRSVGNGAAAAAALARVKTAETPHAGGRRQAPEPGEANAFHPGGRNMRDVWTIATAPYPDAHFATFPPKLVEPCIKAGCPPDGVVLDPFAGTGTVGMVAQALGRRAVLIDLNPEYLRQCLARAAREWLVGGPILEDRDTAVSPEDSLWAIE